MSNQINGQYFRDLDLLRAIAVLMVVVHHWTVGESILHYGGAMGVNLFFVLSGFLITLILLNQKEDYLQGDSTRKKLILKTFYIRRTLRIFPIYYLYVFALLALGTGQVREVWPWLLTYSYNLQLWLTNIWHTGYIEHLWSLAMEEQFYLIWPFVILGVPRRYTLHAILIFIVLGMMSRGIFYLRDPGSQYSKFTFSAFDAFGLGALFAYYNRQGIKIPYQGAGFVVSFMLFVFGKWNGIHFVGKSGLFQVLPFYPLACAFAIQAAYHGFPIWLKKLLDFDWMVYIGRISYGIYLYHLMVPDLLKYLLGKADIQLAHMSVPFLAGCTLLTWVICQASWLWIEQPINMLKDRYKYKVK